MTSLPLHPAIVHAPLGLAFILPALAIGYAWVVWKGTVRPRAWLAIVALQAVLLAAGLVAMNTGEREEDRVERLVPGAALEQHEAYAEQFVWATGFTLVLAGLVLVSRRPAIAHALTLASVAGTIVVAAAAIRSAMPAGGSSTCTMRARPTAVSRQPQVPMQARRPPARPAVATKAIGSGRA